MLILTHSKLADFVACERRFQLRHGQQLAWPIPPFEGQLERGRVLGQLFHQRLERHFLGLPVDDEPEADPELGRWWRQFRQAGPDIPAGDLYPEFGLTVPVGGLLLTGRYDLLVLNDEGAHIFDWKTHHRPPTVEKMRQHFQTRLYLALAVAGGRALPRVYTADQIRLTYWFVNDPSATMTFRYSQNKHDDNWAEIQALVQTIEERLADQGVWGLTEDLTHCARCAYQVICDRQVGDPDLSAWEPEEVVEPLEPEAL